VKSETIEYQDGDLTLKGFVAFDDSKAGKRPGILVNPEGFGLGPHAKSRAERLAQLGSVALAADPFGGGAIAKDLDEAMKLPTPLMSDTAKLRARRMMDSRRWRPIRWSIRAAWFRSAIAWAEPSRWRGRCPELSRN
jgi:dienelactone hydrolase